MTTQKPRTRQSVLSDPAFADSGVRSFIARAPRHLPFSELAELVRREFGEARAWPADRIRAYWLAVDRPAARVRSKILSNAEVQAFVDDRIGRMPLTELAAACLAAFGPERAPGRSALGRHWQALREDT